MDDPDRMTATCLGHYAAYATYREQSGDARWAEEEPFVALFAQDFDRLMAQEHLSGEMRAVASQSREETLAVLHMLANEKDTDAGKSYLASRNAQCLGSIDLWPVE
jgi:hypothetical protein